MSPQQKTFVTLLLAGLIAIVTPLLLVLYVDPLQVYHRAFISGMGLNENQRYQNAGLIRSYLADTSLGYDSAVFGTSLSVNFLSGNVASAFGWKKTLRLFVDGGAPAEVRTTVDRALATGRVQHLLWEINPWFMVGEYNNASIEKNFPFYLYDNNLWNDAKYVFNIDTLIMSLRVLAGDMSKNSNTLDKIGYWADDVEAEQQHEKINRAEYVDRVGVYRYDLHLHDWDEKQKWALQYPALDNEVFPVLRPLCNGPVEVVLYIPPHARIYYAEKQDEVYPGVYVIRHVLKEIAGCSNMRLYGFGLMDFTADLNYYRDLKHYNGHVSQKLLEWMGRDEHRLTLDNIAAYESQLIEKISTYQIYSSYPAAPLL